MRVSSADWFKAGVARQRVDPISLGIAPRACTILSKLLLLLLVLRTRGAYSPHHMQDKFICHFRSGAPPPLEIQAQISRQPWSQARHPGT